MGHSHGIEHIFQISTCQPASLTGQIDWANSQPVLNNAAMLSERMRMQ
jgi:hypothetical protein